ncbi:hypothetical protein Moror_13515 [Moniliophthora roreri MCA 2997]|uniref:Uncharacterized protein n=1 Tax=Moniliophthora roreri (strain MCA 2997) TaxID=1381753 RepID=V2WQH3_MONRO|nr:hypothetical protein Moror_13515 [Moniliophthora roreri MCA 2997]
MEAIMDEETRNFFSKDVGLEIKPLKKVQPNDHTLHHYLEYNPDSLFTVEYDQEYFKIVDPIDHCTRENNSEEEGSGEEKLKGEQEELAENDHSDEHLVDEQVYLELAANSQSQSAELSMEEQQVNPPTIQQTLIKQTHIEDTSHTLAKVLSAKSVEREHDDILQFKKDIEALLEKASPPVSLNWPKSDDVLLNDSTLYQPIFQYD